MKHWPLLIFLLFTLGCAATPAAAPTATPEPPPFTLPDGFSLETLPYKFNRPTQFVLQGETLWVAELAAAENEEQGRIVQVDLASGEKETLLEGLDKPTGLAILEDTIWIATRDAILRTPMATPTVVETVLCGLPNNGRSNGTLTPTPDGKLLYETSGNRRDADSGKLWTLNPETGETEALASGLKGAYAHAFDENGRLWITEIVDGSIDDVTLPDEINLVTPDANFGWPTCYGRHLTGPDCDSVRPAVAVLPAHSTPTSIVLSPFQQDTLLVALWLTGEVVQIPFRLTDDNARGNPQPFITDLRNPQHMVVAPDSSLWLSDYARGKIYRIFEEP